MYGKISDILHLLFIFCVYNFECVKYYVKLMVFTIVCGFICNN